MSPIKVHFFNTLALSLSTGKLKNWTYVASIFYYAPHKAITYRKKTLQIQLMFHILLERKMPDTHTSYLLLTSRDSFTTNNTMHLKVDL